MNIQPNQTAITSVVKIEQSEQTMSNYFYQQYDEQLNILVGKKRRPYAKQLIQVKHSIWQFKYDLSLHCQSVTYQEILRFLYGGTNPEKSGSKLMVTCFGLDLSANNP